MIAPGLAAIGHVHFTTAVTTAQKASEEIIMDQGTETPAQGP